MRELELAVAAVFKGKGKERMGEQEFVMFASLDRRWLTPADAQKLMHAAIAAKLLRNEEGNLVPSFDVKEVEVPLGFAPSPKALEVRDGALFPRLVGEISRAARLSKREVIAAVNRKQEEADVEIEVAALLVAWEKGCDLRGYIAEAKAEVLDRYGVTTRSSQGPPSKEAPRSPSPSGGR
ncbi:MAG: DUF2240 family protein [Candidatus Thermoplasmatota archaeon]